MLYETLLCRRSIRQFTDTPVEQHKINTLLNAALLSPSSRNLRPWEFILVDNALLIEKLSRSKPHGSGFLKTAPVAIVVVANAAESDVWVEDTAIASTTLLLMAHELGLGACWCQIRRRQHDRNTSAEAFVRRLLSIPDSSAVESVVGLGYPAETRPPYNENELRTEKCHHNRFGTPYNVTPTASR